LFIVAKEDNPGLDVNDIPAFFRHLLERVDFARDLHFQTRTTIDTLDYSGDGLNAGSKLVIAAAGPKRRELARELPRGLNLPPGFTDPRICLPGILAIQGGGKVSAIESLPLDHALRAFSLVLVVDDSEFAARHQNNWLWVAFTRSNPASDVHGIGSFIESKHWGCAGPLIIDALIKPHHAPPLIEDPEVSKRVDALAARGGPLHGIV
jgi:4-hydroxy-3-polyprenylbenzoate decarboxylase